MLLVGFFSWWYGPGWRDTADRLNTKLTESYQLFSVTTLVNTFFEPWRRIITPPGSSLQDHARSWVDNCISRAVGSTVRLLTLLVAGLVMGFYTVAGGIILILWPILPFIGPLLIIGGLIL